MSETEDLSAGVKKHILFVDDEENILTGLKRTVHALRHEVDASFVSSGQQALQFLAEHACDMLVTDMRMPGMDGAELLSKVAEDYPLIIRILLSGQCDLESFICSACPAHQLLAKPCDANALKRTIDRTFTLRELLADETLRSMIMQMNMLPSPSTLYLRIEHELKKDDVCMQRIGEIIGEDVGMAAKLLQLINSSFFGFNQKIDSLAQAASMLGVSIVQFIMLHVQTFTISDPAVERVIAQTSMHCLRVASLARAIAKREGESPANCLDAYIGGMMHDLGRLIIAVNMPEQYQMIVEQAEQLSQPVWQVELQQTGVTHADIGAYLLGLWGLPEHVVEIVHYHHAPGSCPQDNFFALAAVHVADVLIHNPELEATNATACLDRAYLDGLGLSGRMGDWQACARALMEG